MLRGLASWSATLWLVVMVGCGSGGGGGGGNHDGNGDGGDPAMAPSPPATLTVKQQGADVMLEWPAADRATSYNLYGATSSGAGKDPAARLGSVDGPSATVSGLPQGLTLYFTVTAVNDKGESDPSPEVSITVGGDGGEDGGNDPLLRHQWHLHNTGQEGGTPGEDVRVASVWKDRIDGRGVRIAVVDDGLEIAHEDLAQNVVPGLSFDYVDGDSDPTSGRHGTACAGVAAAARGNGKGGSGAAYGASVVGYNLLQNLTSVNEVDAMTRNVQDIWVSTNSWGDTDSLGVPQPASQTWQDAVVTGLQTGRNGLGTVYLWAAGNGALTDKGLTDNSNLDGQANFFGVIAVGAVGDDGIKAYYSEEGANVWIASPSMGRAKHAITTVDRSGAEGYNQGDSEDNYRDANYTNTFNGTSAATPLAAGVVALMLQTNPNLTWRDARLILAETARFNDQQDPDWAVNGAGFRINHKYGFGVVDAEAAVARARTWQNVGRYTIVTSPTSQPYLPIPDNDPTGVSDSITLQQSGIQQVEFVRVLFHAPDHTWSADLEVELKSPMGTLSLLAVQHAAPQGAEPYDSFIFGSARHLGERADGTWTLTVRDRSAEDTGTFQAWAIEIHGR